MTLGAFYTLNKYHQFIQLGPLKFKSIDNAVLNMSDVDYWMIIKTNFHSRDLIRLNLGRNRLDTIPYAALRNLNHLQILEMSDNQISTAAMTPNGFKGN